MVNGFAVNVTRGAAMTAGVEAVAFGLGLFFYFLWLTLK